MWNYAFLRRSRAETAEKCTRKVWCACKFVVLLNKAIAFLTFSLPSPSLLLKRPTIQRRRRHFQWTNKNFSHSFQPLKEAGKLFCIISDLKVAHKNGWCCLAKCILRLFSATKFYPVCCATLWKHEERLRWMLAANTIFSNSKVNAAIVFYFLNPNSTKLIQTKNDWKAFLVWVNIYLDTVFEV